MGNDCFNIMDMMDFRERDLGFVADKELTTILTKSRANRVRSVTLSGKPLVRYPNRVTVHGSHYAELVSINEWVNQTFGPEKGNADWARDGYVAWFFRKESDAVFFQLVWG